MIATSPLRARVLDALVKANRPVTANQLRSMFLRGTFPPADEVKDVLEAMVAGGWLKRSERPDPNVRFRTNVYYRLIESSFQRKGSTPR